MEIYKNLAGNSGISAYHTGTDFIDVQFADGTIYTYTNGTAGKLLVEKMKKLARLGKGLSTFISTKVKGRYSNKY